MRLTNGIYQNWKELDIMTQPDEKKEAARRYRSLGLKCYYNGDRLKAKTYFEKALEIYTEIGDPEDEAAGYENIGTVYHSLGEYGKTKEYLKRALEITREIGDSNGEGSCCGKLGALFCSLGEYDKAEEYLEKAVEMRKEIGGKEGQADEYINQGKCFVLSETSARLKNVTIRHLRSEKKMATDKRKGRVTQA